VNSDSDNNDYIGFIAQDFEEYFPELLKKNSEHAYYSLAYDRITALNMACIKELKYENTKLKDIVSKLELKVSQLENVINKII
jgi:cell division protein ZapA (FtsZ GTPase activity inhibitor)